MIPSSEWPSARTPLLVTLAAILTSTVGCHGKTEVPLYPVQGQVTVDKVPLPSGIVGLIPDTEHGNQSKLRTWGTLNDNGIYTLFTERRPGAPLGFYKVIVNVNMPPEDPKVPLPNAIYKKAATTDLHFEVTETPFQGAYDLHLKH